MRPIIILSTKYIHEDKNEDCDRFCPSADAQEEYARLRRNEELLLSRLGLLTKSAAGDGDIQRSDDYHPSNSAFSDNGSSKVLLNKVLLYTAQSPSTPDVGVDGTIHQPFSDRIEHLERPDEDERDDDIMAIHHQPAHHHTHEIPQTLHPVTARVAAEDVDQEQLFYLPIGRSAQRRTRHRWEESNDAPMPRNSHYDIKK